MPTPEPPMTGSLGREQKAYKTLKMTHDPTWYKFPRADMVSPYLEGAESIFGTWFPPISTDALGCVGDECQRYNPN